MDELELQEHIYAVDEIVDALDSEEVLNLGPDIIFAIDDAAQDGWHSGSLDP